MTSPAPASPDRRASRPARRFRPSRNAGRVLIVGLGVGLVVEVCGGCSSGTAPRATSTAPAAANSVGGGPAATGSTAGSTPPPSRLRARVVGQLPQPVSRAVAVAAGSRIVVLGGLTTGDVTTGRVVTLDPTSWTGRTGGQLREPVHDASGAWLAGRAVVFGGGSSTEVADVQSWRNGRTQVVGRLPEGRSDSSAVTVGGTAYVLGGFDGSRMTRDIVATRDGAHLRVVGRLKVGVRYAAVAAVGGDIYVVGGQLATTEGTSAGPQSDAIQRFDLGTGRTSVVGHLPESLGHAMAFTVGGRLYVAGGRHLTTATARIWRVDLGTGGVHAVRAGRLPHPLSDAAVVNAGRRGVVLVGGETTGPYAPQTTIVAVTPR
ncbi:MAG TPA: hypothetical protein VFT62_01535 [Mycobacteriales bacterium]|nr:hypothetical protein [Mycobacteriales bacterium]